MEVLGLECRIKNLLERADFGAEVITVSRVTDGKLYHQGDPVSRGKKSIGLDLKSPAGMEAS